MRDCDEHIPIAIEDAKFVSRHNHCRHPREGGDLVKNSARISGCPPQPVLAKAGTGMTVR